MTDTKSKLLEQLANELTPGLPERCGLIGSNGEVQEIANIHGQPDRGFHMEPVAFLEGLEKGAVATWHTHPGGDPNLSEEDMRGFQQWPHLKHYIVGIRDGQPCVACFAIEGGIVMKVNA